MLRTYARLRTGFLVAFAVLTAAAWGYEYVYVRPQKACEASGNWWDPGSRQCGHVLYLPDITGKPLPPGVVAHRPAHAISAPPVAGRGAPRT